MITEKIDKEIENRNAVNVLSKYGNPFFSLGGIIGDKESLVLYGNYRFLEEEKILSWLLHHLDTFPPNIKLELFGMEFFILKSTKEKVKITIPDELFEIWEKPLTTYIESHKGG